MCVCVFIYFRKNQSIHEFDRNEEHPLLGIEFGGGFVVKTRATLSYEVEPPLFPALTLSLFDPVPPACPPLIVVESPFPCGGWLRACLPTSQPASQPACLPSFLRACVSACMSLSIVYAMPPRRVRVCLSFPPPAPFFLSFSFAFPRGRESWFEQRCRQGYRVERIDPRSGISRKISRSLARAASLSQLHN